MTSRKTTVFQYILPVVVILIALFSGACSNPTDVSTPAPAEDETQPQDGYPAYPAPEIIEVEPPYPIDPAEDPFYALLTPEAAPPEYTINTGALTLKVFYGDGERPVRGQLFIAAEMLPAQSAGEGEAYVPAVDISSPQGYSDSHGTVVISNLPPGLYALAIMMPRAPVLPLDVATTEIITFNISANEWVDLGVIKIDLDPTGLEPEE